VIICEIIVHLLVTVQNKSEKNLNRISFIVKYMFTNKIANKLNTISLFYYYVEVGHHNIRKFFGKF